MKKSITSKKVLAIKDLEKKVRMLKRRGKRVIMSHGVFDLLHPGHIRHFEAARRMADILIVTITCDKHVNKGPGRPVFNHRLRAESVAALACVDYVAINQCPTAVETIKLVKPDFYVKGGDYQNKEDDLTGKIDDEEQAITEVGGRLVFTNEVSFSSSEMLNQHFGVYPKAAHAFLKTFKKKHTAGEIIDKLKSVHNQRVLVIGDIIIDEYHYCVGMGKPAKADIISAKYLREERFTGGVLAVAKHVAQFCKDVHLVSTLGSGNSYHDFIRANLAPNITTKLFERSGVPTIVKKRYVNPSFLSKTFEINYIDDTEIPLALSKKICRYLTRKLKEYDMVIVSDFGHGLIDRAIVDLLCDEAKFLCVNTQTNSANMGYNLITKYPRADYVCIDEPEIRLAMRDRFGDLEKIVAGLSAHADCGKIVVTRGHKGALAFEKGKDFFHIPVLSTEIVDRVGAGDAFLAVSSPLVSQGYSLDEIGFIGNAVGAMAVLIVGNKTAIQPVGLYKFITSLLK